MVHNLTRQISLRTFLKKPLKVDSLRKMNGLPRPLKAANPLDYYFWNAVKEKVYEGRMNKPFKDEDELKRRIKSVWPSCAQETDVIRRAMKQFVPRLRAIEEKQGYSIKTAFG